MFPFLFNFWINSLILFHPAAVMWRMPQGNFFGKVAEFLGFSHWDFLHLGRKRLEQGEKKRWDREKKRDGLQRKRVE